MSVSDCLNKINILFSLLSSMTWSYSPRVELFMRFLTVEYYLSEKNFNATAMYLLLHEVHVSDPVNRIADGNKSSTCRIHLLFGKFTVSYVRCVQFHNAFTNMTDLWLDRLIAPFTCILSILIENSFTPSLNAFLIDTSMADFDWIMKKKNTISLVNTVTWRTYVSLPSVNIR